MLMSESQFLEFQRDAASVLYSLSINSDNKLKVYIHPAAQRSPAVRTCILLRAGTMVADRCTLLFQFLESKALPTLVMLARSTDIDIRLNIAGAIYRLCMHPVDIIARIRYVGKSQSCMVMQDIKRPFVEAGVLESIVSFMSGTGSQVGRDLQRNAAFSLKVWAPVPAE